MSNWAPEAFRPYMAGEERQGQPIRAGSYDSAPYWNGIRTAAENFNHILAFAYKPIVNQTGSATLSYTGSSKTFAKYVIWVPRLYSRNKVRVRVTGTTTGGATFTVSGSIDSGSSASSTATASGGVATLDITSPTLDDFGILTLTFVMSATSDLTITNVTVFSAQEAISGGGATLPALQDMCSAFSPALSPSALYTPQGTLDAPVGNQYREGFPLNVAMVGDMQLGLQAAFRDLVAPVTNWSCWSDYSTLTTAGLGAAREYDSAVVDPVPFCQYIYFPRDGVQNLRIFATARVTAGTGKLSVRWRTSSQVSTPITVSATTTDFSSGNWTIWNDSLRVPPGPGPVYLEVRGSKASSGILYLQSFAAFEDSTTVA